MKNILIVGGCGYIGSALYASLSKVYDVCSVDLEWFGNNGIGNQKIDCDSLTEEYLKSFDVVIFAAGHSSVQMCRDNPSSTFKNNVINLFNLVEKISPPTRLIFLSSYRVYNTSSGAVIDENCSNFNLNTFYDLSKYQMDKWVSLIGENTNLEYYCLRLGSVNGFSPNVRDDMLINEIYFNSIRDKEVKIYNTSVNKPILGMEDLGRSVKTIIDNGSFTSRGFYNLCSFQMSTLEIGREISELLKYSLNTGLVEESGPKFSLSTEKFRGIFNFSFKDSVASIVNSLKNGNYIKSGRKETIQYP